MVGTSDALRTAGSLARLALRLAVLGGFVYWFLYATTAFNNGKLQTKAFGDVDARYTIQYKAGGSLGADRLSGEINLAIIVSWSVLLGGAFLTTLSEWLPRESKATRFRRFGTKVQYALDYQLWPRRLWAGLLDGLSVRDLGLIALFCYCVVYACVNNYLGRLQYLPSRFMGVRAAHEGAIRLAMFAHSMGESTMMPIWLLFLTVPKGSFIQTLLGIDYHGMIRYHRWVGNMLFVVITLHGWLHYISWWIQGTAKEEFTMWNSSDVNQLAGSIAWICFVFLFVTSSTWVRRRFYELFYRSHLVFLTGFVVFGSLHSQLSFSYFLPGLLLLAVDLVFRSASYGAITEPVSARVASDGSVGEVALLASTSRIHKPMHRIYLAMDRHSRWQWHPFSVSGRSPDGHLYLAVKRYGAWTSHLLDALSRGERVGLRAHVPRDHAAPSWESEDAVLLVAGGIGVTAALSVLDELVLGWQERPLRRSTTDAVDDADAGLPRKVVFVWVARHTNEFGVLRPNVLEAAGDPSGWLDLRLHCTARSKQGARQLEAAAPTSAGEVAMIALGSSTGGANAGYCPAYARSSGSAASPSAAGPGRVAADFIPGVPGSLAHGQGLDGIPRGPCVDELSTADFGDLGARTGLSLGKGNPDDSDDSPRRIGPEESDSSSRKATSKAFNPSLCKGSAAGSAVGPAGGAMAPAVAGSERALSSPARAPSKCPLGAFTSPFLWSRPRRLRLEQHSDVLFLVVHLLSAFGAYATMCFMGTYGGRAATRAALAGTTTEPNVDWLQSGLYLLGMITGGLGLPFFFIFIYETIAYWLDVHRASVAKSSLPGEDAVAGDLPGHNLVLPYSENAPGIGSAGAKDAKAAAAADVQALGSFEASSSDGALRAMRSGRPNVAELMDEVHQAAGQGGIAGIYVAGSKPLNDALHLACGEHNLKHRDVLFVHHKITGEL